MSKRIILRKAASLLSVSILFSLHPVNITLAKSSNSVTDTKKNNSNTGITDKAISEYKALGKKIIGDVFKKDFSLLQKNSAMEDQYLVTYPSFLNRIKLQFGDIESFYDKITVNAFTEMMNITYYTKNKKGDLKHIFRFNNEGKIEFYSIVESPEGQSTGEFNYKGKTTESGKDELVTFGKLNISGLITTPEKSDKKVIVMMIAGSGPNMLDMPIMKNKPFKEISAFLVENGYTTFRFNKSTYEKSEAMDKITLEEEYFRDVKDAIELLDKNYKDYKIVLLGHSQGAMLLPNFYYENANMVDGLIYVAGTTKSLLEVLVEQNELILEKVKKESNLYAAAYIKNNIATVKKAMELKEDDGKEYGGYPAHYILSLNKARDLSLYSKIKVPFLGIHGDKDFQVKVEDLKEVEKLMKSNKNATFTVVKGMNHMLLPYTGKEMTEDYIEKRNVDETFLREILRFLETNFSK